METYSVRDLRDRTGALIQGAEAGHLALVTKHGRPVILAVPFDDKLLDRGIRVSLAVHLFDEDVLSTREAAKLAGLSLPEFIDACGERQVSMVRYAPGELEKELEAIDELHRRG